MDALDGGVGRPADTPVGFDTTIAVLVVLAHAVCHAFYLAQRLAEQLVPVAIEGNDYRVCYASSGMAGVVGRSNLHDALLKERLKNRSDKVTKRHCVAGQNRRGGKTENP